VSVRRLVEVFVDGLSKVTETRQIG
jgi:hypothetical protein